MRLRYLRVASVCGLLAGALALSGVALSDAPAQGEPARYLPARMADGKQWTTRNLALDLAGAECPPRTDLSCEATGRLYTWRAAVRACRKLGCRWRLPQNSEWRALALAHGGIAADASDGGAAAYDALMEGGGSGFEAHLGGGRQPDGQFARAGAHGFYWTSTKAGGDEAWFYNFARSARLINRHTNDRASLYAVRCIKG